MAAVVHEHEREHGGAEPRAHSHPHERPPAQEHPHTHAEGGWPPSRPGSVALDIGPGVGALVVLVPGGLAGHEIEAERVGVRRTGPGVHTAVRDRLLPGGTVLAAVFQALETGEYELRVRVGDVPSGEVLGTVVVVSGHVTELDLEPAGISVKLT